MNLEKRRVMSGMRPTGDLHLGHLVGVLTQWANYSENDDAFFEIADLHAYTTQFDDPASIRAAREEMVIHLEPRPPYDRQKRLNFARRAIFDLCPDRLTIIACLQSNAFTHREIEDLLPEALALASDDLAGSAPRSAV